MTEITMGTDKIYISAMMDLFNREVIALEISASPNLELMEKTIKRAQKYRQLSDLQDVMIHTDQGSVYRSFRYHQLSKQLHFIPSMSRKANCWDNAVTLVLFLALENGISTSFFSGHGGGVNQGITKIRALL